MNDTTIRVIGRMNNGFWLYTDSRCQSRTSFATTEGICRLASTAAFRAGDDTACCDWDQAELEFANAA